MCNPALVGLALIAGGTAATYAGQRRGAKAAQRVMDKEEAYQRGLRKKSLRAAEETLDRSTPAALAADVAAPQATADAAQVDAATIAKVAEAAGSPSESGQVYDAAVNDAGRTLRPLATRQGFSQGLENQDAALRLLAHENLFLGEDSRRSLSTLNRRLSRAGRAGSGLRLTGQVANLAGGALTGNSLWGPMLSAGAATATTNNSGLGRTRRGQGGRTPEN